MDAAEKSTTRAGDSETERVSTADIRSRQRAALRKLLDELVTLLQAPVPPHIIDKGIPTVALLVHVLIAKFAWIIARSTARKASSSVRGSR